MKSVSQKYYFIVKVEYQQIYTTTCYESDITWLLFSAEGTECSNDVLIREESGEVNARREEAGLTAKAKERAQHEEEEEEEQSSGVQETPSRPEVK